MKKTLIALAIMAASSHVLAHGCSGQAACTQGPVDQSITNNNNNPNAWTNDNRHEENQLQQQQQQDSRSAAYAGGSQSGVSSTNNSSNNSRYLNIRPVIVPASPTMNPTANISRFVDPNCGPRMVVKTEGVTGINNRIWSVKELKVGQRQYVEPDLENGPYRSVKVMDDYYQLIGHKVVDSAAVVNISTSGGFGIGGNGSNGGGASVGMQSSGAAQSMVNQIQLIECVAFEVDTRPLKPRG